jgi:transcription-repair coupling factor (superfamily II helicase)
MTVGDYNRGLFRTTRSAAVPSSRTEPTLPNALLAIPLPACKAGERAQLPTFSGSSDALTLAQLASGRKSLLAVLTASAGDAQRLLDEIPWFAPDLRVRLLPDWETLPYDSFSPHHDLISERLATLYAITRGECDVLLVPASTAAYRFAPPAYLAAYTFFFKKGETLDAEALRAQLTLAGYTNVTNVVSPGEYSIRGGLVDLFPMGSQLPYRLDLFDDEIESIKTFDVDTQRTLYPVPEIRLLPAREFPLDDKGRTRFRQRFREVFEGDPAKSGIYKDISAASPRPASSTGCRCSSRKRRHSSTICRRTPRSACTTTCPRPSATSGATRRRATTCSRAKRQGRCCLRRTLPQRGSVLHRRQALHAARAGKGSDGATRPIAACRRRSPRR